MDVHELLRSWASPVIAAVSLAFAVITGRGKAAKEEQDRIEGRLSAVEAKAGDGRARLTEVELTVRHLPTREQFHGIELTVSTMAGDIKVLTAGFARVEKLLESRER